MIYRVQLLLIGRERTSENDNLSKIIPKETLPLYASQDQPVNVKQNTSLLNILKQKQ